MLVGTAIPVAAVFALCEPAQARVTASAAFATFGPQIIGTTSAPLNITLTNTGRRETTIVGASLSLAVFSWSGFSLPVTLFPDQSVVVAVTFAPSAAQMYSDLLVFTSANGFTSSVALSGTGIPAPPVISTQPVSQSVIAGQTATFSVAAASTVPVSYQWLKNGAAISGATSPIYTTPATTASDEGAQFTVTVTNSTGSITSAPATLTAIPATFLLALASTVLSFGNVDLSATTSQSVTLTNAGNSAVTISNVTVSGAGFTASGVAGGLILPPGQTATLNVTFAPAASGTVAGSVAVASNATNSPALITLSGAGVAPSVVLSWTASTSAVIGYNSYSSAVPGGPYNKLNASPVATTTYTDNTVQSGKTYYYVVTSVDSDNVESVFSNEVSVTVP